MANHDTKMRNRSREGYHDALNDKECAATLIYIMEGPEIADSYLFGWERGCAKAARQQEKEGEQT
jgi:hypothetical protein